MIPALVIFFAAYALMLITPKLRHAVSAAAAALFLALGILPLGKALPAIDFNVIMMLAGTMGLVSLFIGAGIPQRLADKLMSKMPSVRWAVVLLALFSGFVSAFIDNVATLLSVAPIGIAVSKRLGISPTPVVIAIAVHANLQGAATLVGDTTSILLGGYAGMDFLDFFFFDGRLSIFWAVELGAVVTVPILMFVFRRDNQRIPDVSVAEVSDYFPAVLLSALVLLLIGASFIRDKPSVTNGLICVALCAIGMARAGVKSGGLAVIKKTAAEIDVSTLILLTGLFIVIAGIREAGVIDEISKAFLRVSGDNLFIIYTLLVFGSVLFSAFIDNIPYFAAMLPVVTLISDAMRVDPTILYFGLLIGATLGGNLTPIGASTNIAAAGMLRREGYEVTTPDYMRIGVPVTAAAVLTGYAFIWLVWS
jgi:Na+/H+ antiporter NhaD/arsenite permease-like protein